MSKAVFYFHGFMSSADSSKAQVFKKFIKSKKDSIDIYIPNILDKFTEAIPQLDNLIDNTNAKEKFFIGSSLGGFFATHYAEQLNAKAVVINPAINPSEGLKMYLGVNENYSSGEEFVLTDEDIKAIKKLEMQNLKNPKDYLLLCETKDEVLNYLNAVSFYSSSYQDISYGGDHSYSCFPHKLGIIDKFLNL